MTRDQFPAAEFCRRSMLKRNRPQKTAKPAAIAQLGKRQTDHVQVSGSIPGLGTFSTSACIGHRVCVIAGSAIVQLVRIFGSHRSDSGSSPGGGTFWRTTRSSGRAAPNTNPTARGFEPLRAEPNGFLVHHLNHLVTLSLPAQLLPNTIATTARHNKTRGARPEAMYSST